MSKEKIVCFGPKFLLLVTENFDWKYIFYFPELLLFPVLLKSWAVAVVAVSGFVKNSEGIF